MKKMRKNISSNLIFNDLPFLPERMKIKKVKKLVTNLHDKAEYVFDKI